MDSCISTKQPCPVLTVHLEEAEEWRRSQREDAQEIYDRLREIEKTLAVQDMTAKGIKESVDKLTESVGSVEKTLTMGKGVWWFIGAIVSLGAIWTFGESVVNAVRGGR